MVSITPIKQRLSIKDTINREIKGPATKQQQNHILVVTSELYVITTLSYQSVVVPSVVLGVLGIGEVENDGRMRPSTTTVAGEDALEIDCPVEAEASVGKDVNPVALVVSRGVDNRDLFESRSANREFPYWRATHIAALDKVSGNKQVLLVGANLDVVRPDDGLRLVRVVEPLDVAQVRDIECRDVVAESDGEVRQLAVVADIRVDGQGVLRLGTEVVEQLGDALLAGRVAAEGVDDPDLAWADGAGEKRLSVIALCGDNGRETYVAMAALSGFPGMNFTSWMPSPCVRMRQSESQSFGRRGLTLGMMMVEMIVRSDKFHSLSVLAF